MGTTDTFSPLTFPEVIAMLPRASTSEGEMPKLVGVAGRGGGTGLYV